MPDQSSEPAGETKPDLFPNAREAPAREEGAAERDLFPKADQEAARDDGAAQRDLFDSARRVETREEAAAERESAQERAREARLSSTRTWLEGSGTARAWNMTVLAYAALFAGIGILAFVGARFYLPTSIGDIIAPVSLWVAMAVPIVIALVRTRPRGLFRFRWTDLIWGIGLGVILRLVQGWLEVAAGSAGGLPRYVTLDGQLGAAWILVGLLGPVLIAPVLEELLFRGVILVSVFRLARRGIEGALLAIVASTALFVAIHAVSGIGRWDAVVMLVLVGATASGVVLLTGRIWGAVLLHATYNGAYVALALVGTALA